MDACSPEFKGRLHVYRSQHKHIKGETNRVRVRAPPSWNTLGLYRRIIRITSPAPTLQHKLVTSYRKSTDLFLVCFCFNHFLCFSTTALKHDKAQLLLL